MLIFMQDKIIASYLWTKTRRIKSADLEWFSQYPDLSFHEWKQVIQNPGLKHYLQQNQDYYKIAQEELLHLSQKAYRYTYWGQKDYIRTFLDLEHPPLFYIYKGDLKLLDLLKISVVGSRKPSQAAISWMQSDFYYYLKSVCPTVVSGAAVGIDQISHELAVKTGCGIVAVLPSGLEAVYPTSYSRFIEQGYDRSLFLSEYSINEKMHKHYFHQRNRLIAALSPYLFIAEAKRRSGSLISARYAMDLGREIFVLPSCPTNYQRLGTLDLMYDGANPIRDYEDLRFFTVSR
tara:strand:+ start:2055 stop:2924 length:870 start_codon:yes stop_codon:yes gene_type:complete